MQPVRWQFVLLYLKPTVESDSDDDEPLERSKKQETDAGMDIGDKTFPEVAFAVDKAILREVEEMEEKVFTASLQVKVSEECLEY